MYPLGGAPGACPTKYRIDQFRSNSNFAWNSYRCAFEDSRPIITKFGTRHDSRTVVTCTKFRYDRPTIIEIRGTRIFSKFWIRSNLSIRYLVGQAPGRHLGFTRLVSVHFIAQPMIYTKQWRLLMPIEAETKCPGFCRRHFQIHFLQISYIIKNIFWKF